MQRGVKNLNRPTKPKTMNKTMTNETAGISHVAASATGSTSLVQKLRSLYFRIFKRYRRLEFRAVSYADGDKLIRASVGKPESETWVLAIPEEDNNRAFGLVVMLERRERIWM